MISLARRRLRTVLLVAVLLVALLVPAGLWLRSSSLVGVTEVQVSGIEGPQAQQIRSALTGAGLGMTTLDVDDAALRDAVSSFPIVRDLRTTADFPHGLRIEVNAYVAVAAVTAGGDATAVAFDGALLRGSPTEGLTLLDVDRMPTGDRVSDRETARAIRLLAAAPASLRARVVQMSRGTRGLAAELQEGPKLYFGGAVRSGAKWAAAAEVLADQSSAGASYVDLRLPERPVAGGFQPRTGEDSGSTLG
ncbi:MAG: cell division protein FtsQ/DivIB [Solirubrobacteraceae bacterium]